MPRSFKVVIVVAGNSESVVLDQLLPDTQYQMWVQAFRAGKRFRSRQIVFRTLGEYLVPGATQRTVSQESATESEGRVQGKG